MKPIVDISTKGYDFVQDINAKAVWLCEKAQITQMVKQEPLPTQLSEPATLLPILQSNIRPYTAMDDQETEVQS